MGTCDIQDGRLLNDCNSERAGVKTVYFFKYSALDVVKNLAGEIIDFGTGLLFRYEQDGFHGLAVQEIIRGEGVTSYLQFQIDFTVQYVDPAFLETINFLKVGLWAIFFLDYDDKLRLMGEFAAMTNSAGIYPSGTGPGDTRWTNLTFVGLSSDYAPFLVQSPYYPFDNFPGVVIVPPYPEIPGEILANATDFVLVNATDKLDHNN